MNLKEKSRKSKSKLLKSAEVCFSKHGFDVTSVAEVCKHAGMSKGAFYHHFSSKQALFLELLNQWLKIIDEYLNSAQHDSDNVLELLIDIASKAQPVFKEAGGQLPIFLELWIKASRDPKLRKITIVSYQKYLDFFKKVVDEGTKEKLIRKINPDIVSRIIIAVAVGLMMQGLLDPQGADWDEVAKESAMIILKGLQN